VFRSAISSALKRKGSRGDLITTQTDDEWTAQYLKRVQSVVMRRRLILTLREEFAGLAHSSAQEGDLVCVLYGCSVPVILRKIGPRSNEGLLSDQSSSDHYEFIGECYIHGMMDGEAIQPRHKQNLVQRIFELR
jgi:hypothetical protein